MTTDADRIAERMHRLAGSGRCGELASEHLAAAGKRLRARLAIDAARALGATDDAALAWGTCCELLHEASLVHDDVQDGDRLRRGRPTLWATHGAAQAINVGDLLILLAVEAVGEVPASDAVRWRLARALAHHAALAARGQALDLAPPDAGRMRWADWEQAALGKTGALFALPVHGAVVLAGGTEAEAAAQAAPFARLGLLYQIGDDVANLFGDPADPRCGSDVRDGRLTALVAQHVELWPGDVPWMLGALRGGDPATVRARFRDAGALEALLERAHHLATAIRRERGPLVGLAVDLLARLLGPLEALDASLPVPA